MDEEKETTTKGNSFFNVFQNFAENTTAHGFSQILITTSLVVKITWIIILIGCAVTLSFQIQPLFKRYFERPTATKISLISATAVDYPVIVVCNENRILEYKYKQYKQNKQYYDDISIENEDDMVGYISSENDPRDLFGYGHDFSIFVEKCRYKLWSCKDFDNYEWRKVWHYKLGSCYAFNTGFRVNGSDYDIWNVTKTGAGSGLDLVLNIQRDEYNTGITENAGVRIYIGDQGALYTPLTNGIAFSPGFAYSVSLRKKVVQRTDPFQNRTCIPNERVNLTPDGISQSAITKYTVEFCYLECLAQEMFRECSCIAYWLPKIGTNKKYPLCSTIDQKRCSTTMIGYYHAGILHCLSDCKPPCSEVQFLKTIGMQKYPAKPSSDDDEKSFKFKNDNLVRVSIYFSDLSYEHIEDYKSYQLEDLLGGIGGQLGLFNGYSILTMVEIVLFVFQVLGIGLYMSVNYFRKEKEIGIQS